MSSNPKEPVKLWPRMAVGPLGNSARFYGPGDIPHGWKLDPPLDDPSGVVLPPEVKIEARPADPPGIIDRSQGREIDPNTATINGRPFLEVMAERDLAFRAARRPLTAEEMAEVRRKSEPAKPRRKPGRPPKAKDGDEHPAS